jgi:predicted Ser/Thr protein kinase
MAGLEPGAQLGKYQLRGVLGRGGMGEVWVALDPDLDRKVALKVLRADSTDNRLRLLREARAMARLRHPNVVTVYEATTVEGRDLVAMELVDGTHMGAWLESAPSRERIVEVLLAAGRGLCAAHDAGLVHRDFKPHNVLVQRDGRVLVGDFGLARAVVEEPPPAPAHRPPPSDAPMDLESTVGATVTAAAATPGALDSTLTRTGALLGTPAYMAPEQIDGDAADARADQFAFCVTAWEALAGTRPFAGATLAALRVAVADGVRLGEDRIPRRLRPILARGLAAAPAARFDSLAALLRAFERAWRRPRRLALAAVAVVVLAGGTAGALALRGSGTKTVTREVACRDPDVELARSAPALHELAQKLVPFGQRGAEDVAFIDGWRASWRASYSRVCAQPADPQFAARRQCLESMLHQLESLVALVPYVPIDKIAEVDAADAISDPAECIEHPYAFYVATSSAPMDVRNRLESDVIKLQMGIAGGETAQSREAFALQLQAEARKTGDQGLVLDVLHGTSLSLAKRCDVLEEAANLADQLGADRQRAEALLDLLWCQPPERVAERAALLARTRSVIERLGNPMLLGKLHSFIAEDAYLRGAWDEAVTEADAAYAAWQRPGSRIHAMQGALLVARMRRVRHAPGDLALAERLLRELLPHAPCTWCTREAAHQLGRIAWFEGRFEDAARYVHALAQPVTGGAPREVSVAGGEADVYAAVRPVGDPLQLVMPEFSPVATSHTDANGVATLVTPPDALLFARAGDRVAVGASSPLRLGPAGTLTGHATVDDTAHELPIVAIAIDVAGHAWTRYTPIAADGSFRMPLLVPGHHRVTLEAHFARGDTCVAEASVDIRAGATTAVALALPTLAPLRVVAHPAFTGNVVALAGRHAQLASAPLTSRNRGGPLETRAGDGFLAGDSVTPLGAPPPPYTVCLAPEGSPPRCKVIEKAASTITVP